jgi:hypothetical protein
MIRPQAVDGLFGLFRDQAGYRHRAARNFQRGLGAAGLIEGTVRNCRPGSA